jgi:beta-glucosidase
MKPRTIDRRDLAKVAGGATLLGLSAVGNEGCTGSGNTKVASSNAPAAAQRVVRSSESRRFPDGFKWGTATSAFQIEGAVKEDGRGVSIWDTFAHTPGKINGNASPDVAVNHYHLYKEDVSLMKSLGANAYRFSISWPRIFPQGTGAPNPKGVDFYSRLVDELLANGIEPFATLFHWDLPQTLQDRFEGWQSRETSHAFAEYAGYIASRLSDRVPNFFTINELTSIAKFGHALGTHPPGLKLPPGRLNQVQHHLVLGHGLAVQAIRARARGETKVGPAEQVISAIPIVGTPENVRAAEVATRELNAAFLTVMLEGRYTDAFLESAGRDAPKFSDADLRTIASPLDFVGTNLYQAHHYVRASEDSPGYAIVAFQNTHPSAPFPGVPGFPFSIEMTPEVMYWHPRSLKALWNVKEIYITENGVPFAHAPAADGTDDDSDRVMWLRAYLSEMQRATSEGIPVRGYFHWTLVDHFEWNAGYVPRFGLYSVDRETQKRFPKLSTQFYREITARNAVV